MSIFSPTTPVTGQAFDDIRTFVRRYNEVEGRLAEDSRMDLPQNAIDILLALPKPPTPVVMDQTPTVPHVVQSPPIVHTSPVIHGLVNLPPMHYVGANATWDEAIAHIYGDPKPSPKKRNKDEL